MAPRPIPSSSTWFRVTPALAGRHRVSEATLAKSKVDLVTAAGEFTWTINGSRTFNCQDLFSYRLPMISIWALEEEPTNITALVVNGNLVRPECAGGSCSVQDLQLGFEEALALESEVLPNSLNDFGYPSDISLFCDAYPMFNRYGFGLLSRSRDMRSRINLDAGHGCDRGWLDCVVLGVSLNHQPCGKLIDMHMSLLVNDWTRGFHVVM